LQQFIRHGPDCTTTVRSGDAEVAASIAPDPSMPSQAFVAPASYPFTVTDALQLLADICAAVKPMG
jgi:hypothetical protein